MGTPRMSIITPSFNYERYLEQAIRSVESQGYPDYEHIVVENSTIKPREIMEKHPEVKWMLIEEWRSQAEALNVGFREAGGDMVGWLNADDFYEPGAFTTASEYLVRHPGVDLVYSDCRLVDEEDGEIGVWRTRHFNYFINLNIAQIIPHPTIFFRRHVFEKVGYINEGIRFVVDKEFLIRVSKRCRISYIPHTILANYRVHPRSITTTRKNEWRAEDVAVRKMHGAIVPNWLVEPMLLMREFLKNFFGILLQPFQKKL